MFTTLLLKENDSYGDEKLNRIIQQPLDVDLAIFFHPTCCILQVHCKLQIQVMHITDYGDTMRAFFQLSKRFWPIGKIGRISCEVFQGIFGSYYLLKFCHCVSLVRDFALLSYFFCKKLRFLDILQDFLFGIRIWSWAVENLGSSHHEFVVRDARQAQGRKIYLDISKLAWSLKNCWA